MMHDDADLIDRVSRLVNNNKQLKELVEKLRSENESLKKKNHKVNGIDQNKLFTSGKTMGIKSEMVHRFNMATVLYASIDGFQKLSREKDQLPHVDTLDQVYIEFDSIVNEFKVLKIKTLGDAYMCAGGIPDKNIINPVQIVHLALRMADYLNTIKLHSKEKFIWDISIGVHTGPVVANISGKKMKNVDIKGDTVNIASRIHNSAQPGEVLVSAMTYEAIKEFFLCEIAGNLPIKYKGDIGLYKVKSLKPQFTDVPGSVFPNEYFYIQFKLIQFTDIQEIILDMLEHELPENLYYHNVKHTVDVVTEVELIGWAENITPEEMLLLKTAALFHDAGHTISYQDHEEQGCLLVRKFLPDYGYTEEQIARICELIMATKMPPEPKNLLEQIICDADLDYLGRSDFIPVSYNLYKEFHERSMIGSLNEWNKLQIKFISRHAYNTKTARALREINKQKQIERIKELIKEV